MEMIGLFPPVGPSLKKLPKISADLSKKYPFMTSKIKACTKKNPNERPNVIDLLTEFKSMDPRGSSTGESINMML